jgi:hypothetical protein
MTRTATCSCGQLSVRLAGDPEQILLCHCIECQRQSGSAFGAWAFWPKSSVREIIGESRIFQRSSDTGRRMARHFCPVCGSTVFSYFESAPNAISIPLGAITDQLSMSPVASYWNRTRYRWVGIPDEFRQYETQ